MDYIVNVINTKYAYRGDDNDGVSFWQFVCFSSLMIKFNVFSFRIAFRKDISACCMYAYLYLYFFGLERRGSKST